MSMIYLLDQDRGEHSPLSGAIRLWRDSLELPVLVGIFRAFFNAVLVPGDNGRSGTRAVNDIMSDNSIDMQDQVYWK